MMSDAGTSPVLLLERARAGDGEARNRLFEEYRNYLQLLTRSRSLVGPALRGRFEHSDLIQETLLNAHQHFGEFRGSTEGELVRWLRAILASVLSNQIKKHRRESRDQRREESLEVLLDRSSEALQRALAAPQSSPSAQASRRERAVLLANAVARLTPDQREVFTLRHLEWMPVASIAETMGRTVPEVQMLWARALKKLNSLLEERP
jgi:RNA polymerase sigma-70 factor (ECF subfamily)